MTTTDAPGTAHPGHAALVELLDGRGLLSPAWRAVWEELPRHQFIPRQIWRQGPERCESVTTEGEWWRLVHSDEPVVTQVDDGREDGPGVATSSNSKPSMVATMLGCLDVRGHERVLEIGTATGHVAALLARRLGDDRIVSVEIDPRLAARAERNLAAVRAPRVTVVRADGEHGWPPGAPYDRLISTCALRHVPYELVRQVKPDGILVAPMARDFWSGAVLRLRVHADGTASGPFTGGASYMPMKSHRTTASGRPVDQSTARSADSGTGPRDLLSLGFALYAGALLPGVSMVHAETGGTDRVWLLDRDGSGAIADAGEPVWQYGPRSLWSEVEAAYSDYLDLGEPPASAFGMTIGRESRQTWLHTPDQVIGA
ncbi:methyltransferase domain-containing protein [Streptomyces sp. NPDC050610]|uniref:methyltransferase domain-containing protein n=1 Tax=Streptomyces sp. NPDC050610 TaxID=3157097 RepID=UPI00343F8C57